MDRKTAYRYIWQKTDENQARLLRVYGQTPEVILPGQIAGSDLTEIGGYCFAESERLPKEHCYLTEWKNGEESTRAYDLAEADTGCGTGIQENLQGMRVLSGSYIERVVLPDTVVALGSLAFYNCRNLKEISVGRCLMQIGSDAFMNCKNFHTLTVRCKVETASGARQILAQIASDLEVTFVAEQGIEAKILFPEYYESYDEIAPAHLFGRNIEGEGFRARQCFKDGVMDLAAYDGIFPQACVEESERILGRIAENRLHYPVLLSQNARNLYEAYWKEHDCSLAVSRVKEKNLVSLEFLCKQGLLSQAAMKEAILECSRQEWPEGAASLIAYQSTSANKMNRYEFDDF